MGLSFSVPKDVKIPPSLKNIYKELKNDLEIECPQHGDLTKWSQQGVLLLNSALTVRQHCPNSHAKYWTPFTDNFIKYLSEKGNLDALFQKTPEGEVFSCKLWEVLKSL